MCGVEAGFGRTPAVAWVRACVERVVSEWKAKPWTGIAMLQANESKFFILYCCSVDVPVMRSPFRKAGADSF